METGLVPLPRQSIWTLEEGLALVRHVNPFLLRQGYFLGLSGGVLFRGQSTHDLDLLVVPMTSAYQDRDRAFAALTQAGLQLSLPREVVHRSWRARGIMDQKDVSCWVWEGRRVDIIHCEIKHGQ